MLEKNVKIAEIDAETGFENFTITIAEDRAKHRMITSDAAARSSVEQSLRP